ncbi:SIS domain-containing protein [Thiotrichales bacterium 19X7-9]|nr:SIS domain-containing protein [Thiotrichales bacterium 19X7-9]TNF70012.1 MAG: SIS domain-containing protein [Gammaproteobacteria bacterium]UTW42013.1 SIS domain-containing protein [bacterium SCSIO 12844]
MISVMEKEALSTPEKIHNQLTKNVHLWQEVVDKMKANEPSFAVTIARGSSDHAATFAKYLFEINLNLVTASAAPSTVTIYNQVLKMQNALVVAISQSGQSPDICQFFQTATESGAQTIALVNRKNSPLASIATNPIPVWADKEHAIAATKSFIATLVALIQFIAMYQNNKQLLQALNRLPEYLEACTKMNWTAAIDALYLSSNTYITARGYGLPIAQEAALKLKETSNLHAEAFSSAELLHGPFALVKRHFPVLIFAQNDASLKGTLDVTKKMTELGAKTLFAMPGKVEHLISSTRLPMPESLHPILDPLLVIQSFYIMAARLAKARGLNPDKPENLMKVTETY